MASNRSRSRSKIRKRKRDSELSFLSVLNEVYSKPENITDEIASGLGKDNKRILDVPEEIIQSFDIKPDQIPEPDSDSESDSDSE